MGIYAAHSMSGCIDDYAIDTKFELFSHVTRFFGHKVCLFLRWYRFNYFASNEYVNTVFDVLLVLL